LIFNPRDARAACARSGDVFALIGLSEKRVESTVGLRTHAIVALGCSNVQSRMVSMFGFGTPARRPASCSIPPRRGSNCYGIGVIGAGVIIFAKKSFAA